MKRMHGLVLSAAVLMMAMTMHSAAAQTAAAPAPSVADAPVSTNPSDYFAGDSFAAREADILKRAIASPGGNAGDLLAKYPNHYINLNVRVRPGKGELHSHWNDIFVVLDGEATEVTGGTIPGMTMDANGEGHGEMVVGGVEHKLHKGDVLHITAGTPHQTLMEPGKTFTYLVIKVAKE